MFSWLGEAYKYYGVFGHSGYNYTNKDIKQVPGNIILVLATKCGRYFSRNNSFKNIFLNKQKMKKYIENNSSEYKNIHTRNLHPEYLNQTIEFERVNSLLHGVYNLPTNILVKNKMSLVPLKNQKLSSVLEKISKRVPNGKIGIVFGVFCRGIGNRIGKLNTPSNKMMSIINKKTGKEKRVSKTFINIHSRLRPLEGRLSSHLKKRKIFKKTVPKGSRSVKLKKSFFGRIFRLEK